MVTITSLSGVELPVAGRNVSKIFMPNKNGLFKPPVPPPEGDRIKKEYELTKLKPQVPGNALEYVLLPANGYMEGRLIKKGQVIRVIDLEGSQVFDTIFWDANNFPYNVHNCMLSQIINGKWTNWKPGDVMYSKLGDELAVFTEDTTPGLHAFVGAFCDEPLWRALFGIPGIHSCHDNFVASMKRYGLAAKDIDWGSCISAWMDFRFKPDGGMEVYANHNQPGDYTDFMALTDIILAISSCPDYAIPTNAFDIRPLMAVVFEPNEQYMSKVHTLNKGGWRL